MKRDRPMRVLVTGGAGFIGSHVVDALIERGDEVVVFDDLSTGHRSNIEAHADNPRFRLVVGDISEDLSEPLSSESSFDGLVHLAAQVSVVRSVADPFEDMRTNARGLVQVLEFARAQDKPPKVVYASSAAVYGDTEQVPTPEEASCLPLSPYGIHKHSGEHWLRFYAAAHGVPGSPLRFFNVFGPRQDPSSAYSGVISIFAERARAGKSLTIYGDGEQSRDFVFVSDVVRAVLAGLDVRRSTEPTNVGTGKATSVRALAEALVELTGGQSAIATGPARTGDIRHSCAQVNRLRHEFGIESQVTLHEGLQRLLDSA